MVYTNEHTGKYPIDVGEELIITIGYMAKEPVLDGKFIWKIEYDNSCSKAIELQCGFEGAI